MQRAKRIEREGYGIVRSVISEVAGWQISELCTTKGACDFTLHHVGAPDLLRRVSNLYTRAQDNQRDLIITDTQKLLARELARYDQDMGTYSEAELGAKAVELLQEQRAE